MLWNPLATMREQWSRRPTVSVIDDDIRIQSALRRVFESVGLNVQLFTSGSRFLESPILDDASCIVLDVRFPVSGLKFQEELAKAKIQVPIVFLTGHGDIQMAVRAMKAGAVDFLTKPFREQDLLDAVATALERDWARRAEERAHSALRERLNSLSARERDIVAGVAAGALNKQIAADLGVSEVTVKVHRATAMRKLRAKSVAELVRIAVQAEPLALLPREAHKGEQLQGESLDAIYREPSKHGR